MKNIILLIFSVILLSTIVVAAPSFIFERGQEVNMKISCFDTNNTFCNVNTMCNITAFFPNDTVLLDNLPMEHNTNFYNISMDGNQTNTLGEHSAIVLCTGNTNGFSTFTYLITPSGAPPISSGQGTVVLTIIIILFGLNIFVYVLGIRTTGGENGQNPIMKIALLSLAVVMTLGLTLYSLVLLNETIAMSPTVVAGLETFFMVFRIVITVLFLVLLFVIFSIVLRRFKIKRGMIDED